MVNMKDYVPKIRIGRVINKIPYIPNPEELFSIINNCSSLKFRTIFTLIYSAGLRVSEAANIKLSDIDYSRKTILIRNGKNNKNRYTILADATISMIHDYLKVYKPVEFLFYKKRDITEQISISHIQKTFSNLIIKSNCNQDIHVHTLRHCFATHLLENGTSIFYIMKLLGHSNIQTTMVYLHMQDLSKLNLESPIDHNHIYSTINSSFQSKNLFLQSA
jgi:site-specific recombinase XerD